MTPSQASSKVIEKKVYSNFKDGRQKQQPKFKLGNLVRTADIEKVFSKGDSTDYSYELYTKTQIIPNTIPRYKLKCKPER